MKVESVTLCVFVYSMQTQNVASGALDGYVERPLSWLLLSSYFNLLHLVSTGCNRKSEGK